jgi:hypothetical protein
MVCDNAVFIKLVYLKSPSLKSRFKLCENLSQRLEREFYFRNIRFKYI